MFIAHVYFRVAPDKVEVALAALLAELSSVRGLPGCIAFLPFLDPTEPGALGIVHEWESAEAFARYAASPGFAAVGQLLRPIMVAPPVSKRFDARLLETVA